MNAPPATAPMPPAPVANHGPDDAPPPPPLAIELANVHKSFGRNAVLAGVDLHVPAGKTYAFLGRNGAGKTTTIRMLMGLLHPDAGDIHVLAMSPRNDALAIRRDVGYLAEDQQMWGWMKVREILSFLAPFYPTWDWPYAKELLQQFALSPDTRIKHLSKGQNVRLGLLLALAHRPRLVILDDPALGLDPIMRKEFLRDVVEHLQGRNVTVFFSSHLLYEVEPVADIIGILDHGKIVCESPTDTLRENVRQFLLPAEAWNRLGSNIPGVLDVQSDGPRRAITVANARAARPLLAEAALEEIPLNLDEIFQAYVIGSHNRSTGDAP
ncbi:MAG TPA: ABC transporter ATP-binding protein [Phycisphaerae bacterium]|nr:ABC transporter ATP-binding protein [Phycisphaerae bacterium]